MAAQSEIVVTLDGQVVDAARPVVRADDPMVVRGDGVFETVLVRDGRTCLLEAHLARLGRSAAIIGLPIPDLDRWRNAVAIAEGRWTDAGDAVSRFVLGRGGSTSAFVSVSGLPDRVLGARRDGVSAMTLDRGVHSTAGVDGRRSIAGAKSLSYAVNAAALRHAARLGVGDVVFTSTDGYVLEGPRSNVVIVDADGVLVTPPATLPILAGTTVDAVFDVAAASGLRCARRLIEAVELVAAQGVWLLSSVTLAARVHTLDGSALPAPTEDLDMSALVDVAIVMGR